MDIKGVIIKHGYTIQQVSDAMGVSRVTLSRTIGNNPTVNTLQRIADIIGCQVSEFFNVDTPVIKCPHCGKPINIHID